MQPFGRAVVFTSRAGPTASAHNGVRSPDDLSHGLPWSMGEERRRDLMASAFPVRSSAAIDFTAGEMTLLRALIAGPPTLNRHPLSREFCRGIGWFKPDSGLRDMMARAAAARPPERRRRSGAFGRRRERPPLWGCLDRGSGWRWASTSFSLARR